MRYKELKEAAPPSKVNTKDLTPTQMAIRNMGMFQGMVDKNSDKPEWQFIDQAVKDIMQAIKDVRSNKELARKGQTSLGTPLKNWFLKKYGPVNPKFQDTFIKEINKVIKGFNSDGKKFGSGFKSAAQKYAKVLWDAHVDSEDKIQAFNFMNPPSKGGKKGAGPKPTAPAGGGQPPPSSSPKGSTGGKRKPSQPKGAAPRTAQSKILQDQGLLKSIQALSGELLQKLKNVLMSIAGKKQPANEGLGSWLGQKASSFVNFGTDAKKAYQKGREKASLMDYDEILRKVGTLKKNDANSLLGYVNSIIQGNAPVQPAAQPATSPASKKAAQPAAQKATSTTAKKAAQPASSVPQGGGRVKGAPLSQTPSAIAKRQARAAAKTAQPVAPAVATAAQPAAQASAPNMTKNYPSMTVNYKGPVAQPAQPKMGMSASIPNVKLQAVPGQKPAAAPAQSVAQPVAKTAAKKVAAKPKQPKAAPKYTRKPKPKTVQPAAVNENNIIDRYITLLEEHLK